MLGMQHPNMSSDPSSDAALGSQYSYSCPFQKVNSIEMIVNIVFYANLFRRCFICNDHIYRVYGVVWRCQSVLFDSAKGPLIPGEQNSQLEIVVNVRDVMDTNM